MLLSESPRLGIDTSRACNYRWSAFSTVIAIQAALERPCLLAVALSTATTSGVSGTLMIPSSLCVPKA